MWGNLFDVVCEKYGWTLEYTLWGISAVNVSMMLSDSISVFYNHNSDDDVLDATDPANFERIRQMF